MRLQGITNSMVRRIAQQLPLEAVEDPMEEPVEEPTQETVQELQSRLIDTYGVDLSLMETPGGLTLSKIVVPEESRESGIGSQVMDEITQYADAQGLSMALTPEDSYGGNVKRLNKFYNNFGFVPNKGKNKDYSFMESYVRPTGE